MRTAISIFFLAFSLMLFSQDEKPVKRKKRKTDTSKIMKQMQRLEIPIENFSDQFEIVDGFEDGLLVAQETSENVSVGVLWRFHLVDRDLKIIWTRDELIVDRAELRGFDYNSGYYFLLYDIPGKRLEYRLLVLDVKGRKSVTHQFEVPFEVDLDYFEALDQGVLMVGMHNFRPVGFIYDLGKGTPKILPGFYNNNERVFDLVMDEKNKSFSVVLSERMLNGKYTNRIKTFTYDGLLVLENLIHPGEDLNLLDGTTTSFNSGIQFMAGTYSYRASNYSRGIYLSKFVNGQQRFIKQHNYGDLNNFFAYRGDRAARRIARKVERKKERGREPRFSYRLYIHDIVQKGEQSVMIAEAFYAKYSSNNGGAFNNSFGQTWNGSPYGYGGFRDFLGYKYTHAIIVAFDASGEIVWDNSFRTNDITYFNLQESVAANVQGEKAIISYLDDNQIKSKIIDGNQVIEGKTFSPIKLLYNGDKLTSRDSEIRGVRDWYDNYMFSYGLQRIKNSRMVGESRRRKVFYINKIEFDTQLGPSDYLPVTFKESENLEERAPTETTYSVE